MSNVSTAKGKYTFDFSNTKGMTNKNLTTWLRRFMLIMGNQEYATKFKSKPLDITVRNSVDKVTLDFTADGDYAYRHNLRQLTNKSSFLNYLLREMNGVFIYVDYVDYETGFDFIECGKSLIHVNNKVRVDIDAVEEELTKERFIEYKAGTIDDWKNLGFDD